MSRIPAQLFRRAKIKDRVEKRLTVFDIEGLKGKIPAFVGAMRKKGIANVDPVAIEKLLSSYGFDYRGIGALDLNFDLEGTIPQYVTDIDGSRLEPTELAIIFTHYLHSIGQTGEIVKSSYVPSSFDRIGQLLNLKVKTIRMGETALLRYPKAILEVLSNGCIHFNYRDEYFTSSPVAERLLALEIMLKSKMTLLEYLGSINQQEKRIASAQTAVKTSTLIGDDEYQMTVPFS